MTNIHKGFHLPGSAPMDCEACGMFIARTPPRGTVVDITADSPEWMTTGFTGFTPPTMFRITISEEFAHPERVDIANINLVEA